MLAVVFLINSVRVAISTQCNASSLTTASLQIETSAGAALKNESWENGTSYVLRCKNTTHSWVNGVRRTADVDVEIIDYYSSGSQLGTIEVSCTDGVFKPDIFTDLDTWCGAGCSPIPTDDDHYWSPDYPSDALASSLSSAPVVNSSSNVVTLACRGGYVEKSGDTGANTTTCVGGSWSNMSSFIECVPGCSDVTGDYMKRTSLTAKREYGYAPFVTGDTVAFTCESGYEIVGNSSVTCTSVNEWDPTLPTCTSETETIATTSLLLYFNILALLSVYYCSF